MRRTRNARIFLAGVLLLPVGFWAHGLDVRFSKPEYRNDEDLYTLLSLIGLLLLLIGFILIVTAVFHGLRKIDRLTDDDLEGRLSSVRSSETS
ncbi:hypothetical protein QF031_002119 [Pseudarthrobacter defluvii]|uniref:hypothetical protein n=1 Tax=Pseudarthrobacter defluvii TaxID=410837 RepID=UPI0027881A69|nr:hypothetical protein [Pseudarthrobacter defluvii]MDQ0769370.1 hypothetical protein [Pseudarthrobacter defluvii]